MFKTDPVIMLQIMHMIDMDINWYEKTFETVLAKLQRNCDKTKQKMAKQKMGKTLLTSVTKSNYHSIHFIIVFVIVCTIHA